jgi:hypothetical protein
MGNDVTEAYCMVSHNLEYFLNHRSLDFDAIYQDYLQLGHAGDHSDVEADYDTDAEA